MLTIYKFGLLTLVLSEYGFQSKDRALAKFNAPWRPDRTLLRLGLWIVYWLLADHPIDRGSVILLPALIVVGEISAALFRRRLRSDAAAGSPLGRPINHMLPLILSLVYALTALAVMRIDGAVPEFVRPQFGDTAMTFALAVTVLWCWSTMLTVSVVESARVGESSNGDRGAEGAGEVIGILERLLTFVLVISGGLVAVGFVVAAKAAARFPRFSKEAFAEYFLIGTLTSVGLSVLIGLAIRAELMP